MAMQLDPETRAQLIKAQHNEITEYHIYSRLARRVRDKHNSEILAKIGNDEKEHYEVWKSYTGEDVKPGRLKILLFTFVSRVLGLTFGLKLMEKGEAAQINYDLIAKTIAKAEEVEADEDRQTARVRRVDRPRAHLRAPGPDATRSEYLAVTVFLLVLPSREPRAGHRGAHHSVLQLLRVGRAGSRLQESILRDGRSQPGHRGVQLRGRGIGAATVDAGPEKSAS